MWLREQHFGKKFIDKDVDILDPVTDSSTLRGAAPEAWAYKLGNRCAIDWMIDQHKEKKPKDPTIRECFDTYRFANQKEKVIDLLLRVSAVSVQTQRIVQAMRAAQR